MIPRSIETLLEDQESRMQKLLAKEFDTPERVVPHTHVSDGYVYNDEEHKNDAPILRCKECGEYYEGINEG